eukprot:3488720-Pyramimonas_sp.AAC.1
MVAKRSRCNGTDFALGVTQAWPSPASRPSPTPPFQRWTSTPTATCPKVGSFTAPRSSIRAAHGGPHPRSQSHARL